MGGGEGGETFCVSRLGVLWPAFNNSGQHFVVGDLEAGFVGPVKQGKVAIIVEANLIEQKRGGGHKDRQREERVSVWVVEGRARKGAHSPSSELACRPPVQWCQRIS